MRRSLCAGTALLLALVTAPAVAEDYAVLTMGKPSGQMSVVEQGTTRRVTYSFNDRGRGPELRTSTELDSTGLPVRLSNEGVNYYKTPVRETFARDGGTATWLAANDKGSEAKPGFYFPHEQTPETLAILARALLKAPGGTLPLLPAGTARIVKLGEERLGDGPGETRASLYAITGLGFSNEPLWLDGRGELVLSGSSWFATVRRGLEGEVERLLKRQRAALQAAERARAPSLMERPAGSVAITNTALFDPAAKQVRAGMTVVVRGNRIVAVGPSGRVKAPAGAKIIDGTGKTLLPGLWDMHVHITSDEDGLLHLANGITAVRDLANDETELLERRAAFDAALLPGPRIVAAGFIDGPGPLAGPTKVLAANAEELRAAIAKYHALGLPGIKLYSSLKPELVPVAVEEAHKRGMRVSGHVPAGMTLRDAVLAGFDEAHHLNFVALNFMGPEINAKTNGITRITAIAERAWEIDPASQQVAELIKLLRARKVVIDPTFSLYEGHLLGRPGTPNPTLAPIIDRLPATVRRTSFGAGLATDAQEQERNARSYSAMQGLLKALYDGGVQLVAGTDAMPGFTLHRELELYAASGIPAADVLRIATLDAARVAGRERELGSVEVGKLADLVLVAGDPTRDMRQVRNVAWVMKDGLVFDPAKLNAALGIAP